MRLVLAVLLVGHASADPKPEAKADTKPAPLIKGVPQARDGVEITPPIDYWDNTTRTPSFGGGRTIDLIERPPVGFTDMRDYSEGGMVIRPPETYDNMVIAPGTDFLPDGRPLQGLWKVLQYGADRMFETLIPSAGGT